MGVWGGDAHSPMFAPGHCAGLTVVLNCPHEESGEARIMEIDWRPHS